MEDYFSDNKVVYWSKLLPDALIPQKHLEDAGYDIYATFEEAFIIIEPFKTGLIPTALSWASSPDFYLQLHERSSTGLRGLKVSGGIIDSGYRGEIQVAIFNANDRAVVFSPYSESEVRKKLKHRPDADTFLFYSTSKAIAQGIIHRVEDITIKEIDISELKQIPSMRGENGWGSSNKN